VELRELSCPDRTTIVVHHRFKEKSMSHPHRGRIAAAVRLTCAVVVASLATAFAAASPASAVDVQFCNSSVNAGVLCPDFPGGERHTYTNALAEMDGNCGIPEIFMYVAYTSSNASAPKYSFSGGTCAVNGLFYNNTELLRPYARHQSSGTPKPIFGHAYY
jgi:hypothetical protein